MKANSNTNKSQTSHFEGMEKLIELPGESKNWIKLKGTQGWKNTQDNTIWKKDLLHGDHWDVTDRSGKKVKEIDFTEKQIWPHDPKHKHKKS